MLDKYVAKKLSVLFNKYPQPYFLAKISIN